MILSGSAVLSEAHAKMLSSWFTDKRRRRRCRRAGVTN